MAFWTKLFVASNLAAYRASRGWVGSKMSGQTVLLLTTLGRRSGKVHTIPINYYLDQERYVIVASNWGSDHHPAWYTNLRHDPHATLQVKDKMIKVNASFAEGEEYERLWRYVASRNPLYPRYQQQTQRKIPVVIFTRI
jgi:deazaflavin-dependent oxidoreductase (nitroreductase family)